MFRGFREVRFTEVSEVTKDSDADNDKAYLRIKPEGTMSTEDCWNIFYEELLHIASQNSNENE